MAKKSARKVEDSAILRAGRHVEPEEESQDVEEDEPETNGKSPSKAEMVRIAMSEGHESPDDGVGFIKKTFGVVMAKPMWSSYKAQQKARDAKKSGSTSRPKAATSSTPPNGIIGDITTLRALIDRHGKDGLLELIEAIG